MSRLYYEKQTSPTFESDSPVEEKKATDYLEKVALLVPSEVIAGYLTMMGLTSAVSSTQARNVTIWIILLAGLILTPVYLNKVAEKGKPKRNHIVLSTIAFLVWAAATTGNQIFQSFNLGEFDPALASISLVLFTLVSGAVPLNK